MQKVIFLERDDREYADRVRGAVEVSLGRAVKDRTAGPNTLIFCTSAEIPSMIHNGTQTCNYENKCVRTPAIRVEAAKTAACWEAFFTKAFTPSALQTTLRCTRLQNRIMTRDQTKLRGSKGEIWGKSIRKTIDTTSRGLID